jgi:ABC-2 type transport system ATP-binding protein
MATAIVPPATPAPAVAVGPTPDGHVLDTRGASAAITVEGLSRRFETFTAVDDLSFAVQPGEVFGFLGPNGAGKSTTIKMLCTLLKPTSGRATVNGFDVVREPARVRASLGIIFQDYSLDDRVTAEENLRYHCMIYHVPRPERTERIKRMLDMVGLADRAGDQVRRFSGGMKRRLEIARGLLHHPAILFLDEPTVGLDPQTRQTIWEHIHSLQREVGITVFMTTHYMEEAEHCDRIGIIDRARLIALDTPAALKASLGGDKVRLTTADDDHALVLLRRDYGLVPTTNGGAIEIEVERGEAYVPGLLRSFPVPVLTVEISKPTLNDVFLRLTGRAIRDESAASTDHLRSVLRRRGGRA